MFKLLGPSAVCGVIFCLTACGDDDGAGNQNHQTNDNQTVCGDGVVEGIEACDHGAANSDSLPDACRTDCQEAHCGDGVQDQGEACDDGPSNSAVVPDACRPGCFAPSCGDGVVDVAEGETCDHGGTPSAICGETCQVIFCGNGVIEDGELCDGGPTPGASPCSPDCRSLCGDGVRTGSEVCDATDLGAWSCASLGYYTGEPTCNGDCDEVLAAGCEGRCGDGVRNGPEACDGQDIPYGCQAFGYLRGEVTCTEDCLADSTACEGYCGDGQADPGEQCDGHDFGGLDCVSLGFEAGALDCDALCRIVAYDCHDYGWIPVSGAWMDDLWGADPGRFLWSVGSYLWVGRMTYVPKMTLGAPGSWDLGAPYLRAIWGSAWNDVFAVGQSGRILHYAGAPLPEGQTTYDPADWVSMASPTTRDLSSVWGTSSSEVFAVGAGGTILHFNGSVWTQMVSNTTQDLRRVWGFSPNDVYAVGGGTGILHWNGSSWTTTTVGVSVVDLWGSSDTGVWAIGGGAVLYLSGGNWTTFYSSATESWRAVGPSRHPGSVTVAGMAIPPPGGRLLRCSRAGCQAEPPPSPTGPNLTLVDALPGYGPVLSGAGTWIQRSLGFVSNPPLGGVTPIRAMHFVEPPGIGLAPSDQGTAIRCLTLGLEHAPKWLSFSLPGHPTAVHGRAVPGDPLAAHFFVVGEGGGICEYQGSCGAEPAGCASQASPTSAALRGVADLDETFATAVGDGGVILEYDGAAWTSVSSPTTARLNAVWGASPSEAHAAGAGGTLLRFDGVSWSAMPSPTTEDITHLWGSSAANLYALGTADTLLHYDGTAWERLPAPGVAVSQLWGRSAREIYALTTEQFLPGLLAFDGSGWHYARHLEPYLSEYRLLTGSSRSLYLLGLDSSTNTGYAADVQIARPVRIGGDCLDPIPLYCQSRVFGDTDAAANRFASYPMCAGLGDQNGTEVSYRIAVPLAGTVTVRLTPHVADLDLVLLGADSQGYCDRQSSCVGYSQGSGIAVEEVSVHATPGETLYVVVDGPAAAQGAAYTLEIDCQRDI